MSRRDSQSRNVLPLRRPRRTRAAPWAVRAFGRRLSRLPLRGFGTIGACVGALLLMPSAVDLAVGLRAGPDARGCRVLQVIDGDTVVLHCAGAGVFRARLVGFDTPEVFSPGCLREWAAGQAATMHLRRLIWSADSVSPNVGGEDRYARRLVEMRLDGARAADLMVGAGHARRYDGGQRGGWCAGA